MNCELGSEARIFLSKTGTAMFNIMKLGMIILSQSLKQEGGKIMVLVVGIEALEDPEVRPAVEVIDILPTSRDDQGWMTEIC